MSQASVSGSVIKSYLIEPDGGVLVDVIVPESERGSKALEAESLPKVRLAKIDVEWVHVISEGWASPLKGFMRENEYLQSLHFNSLRMENGTVVNMSLPIVLAIDDETKKNIGSSKDVGLVGPDGDLLAILRRFVNPFLFYLFVAVFCCCFKKRIFNRICCANTHLCNVVNHINL